MRINQAIDLIKDDLKRVESEFLSNLDSSIPLIKEISEYLLSSGGKRYRPLIHLLSAKLCGYKGSAHIPVAVVLEYLHTATLLHDDVVDKAELRRGRKSANTNWGNGAVVLIGDYLLSKAFYIAVEEGNMELLKVMTGTTTKMATGEILQLIRHSDPDTTAEEHLEVISSKTAILFSAACRLAAILSDAPKEKEEAIATFGMDLGVAYQLVDDCLDYSSSDETLGKAIGNDLREGKVTLPLIKTYGEATADEKEEISLAVMSQEIDDSTLTGVVGLIKKYGGIEYTLDKARSHIDNAKASIEVFEPNAERAAMVAFADYVIERKH